MCGIVGYAGPKDVVPVLMQGLEKLEYRGYDSAGIAYTGDTGHLEIYKESGRLSNLKQLVGEKTAESTTGIAHTRWATHGEPNYANAHPQISPMGDLAVVHNGIIENYMELKRWLQRKGVPFVSETDTEVIVHLINHYLMGDLKEAVANAMQQLEGSYAIAVVSDQFPDEVVACRKDSPLVIGFGDDENMLASDIPAIMDYTKKMCFLEDGEIAVVRASSVHIYDKYMQRVRPKMFDVDWDIAQAEKGGYEHFMIKEIEDQPKALADTFHPRLSEGRVTFDDDVITEEALRNAERVSIVGCGTAYHAGCVGKYVMEQIGRVPVQVDIASEFRYKKPILNKGDLVVVISQSGETADTIAAMREAQAHGAYVLAICNVVGSTIAREADGVFYTHAGLEIAVASTKAFTTQLISLYMFAAELARIRGQISDDEYQTLIAEFERMPEVVREVLEHKETLQRYAAKHFMEHSVFYIGRGLDYALAMEASLKLKEISYIHSEAYAAGELKHGTIALIEPGTLVVALLTQESLLDKTISNIKEVTSRGGVVFAITQARFKDRVSEYADEVFAIPDMLDMAAPIAAIVPMQIFAYFMAVQKGCDVDKPRNLAKSVTVE